MAEKVSKKSEPALEEEIEEIVPDDVPMVTQEELDSLAKTLAAKEANTMSFDAEPVEYGLAGIVLHVLNEHKLWEAQKKIGLRCKVRVTLEKF